MKKLCLLLASALLLCASPVAANPVTGTVTVGVNHIYGLNKNGSDNPAANAVCRATFGRLAGRATTTYTIDPQTLFETAQTTFHGVTYQLYPFGIAGKYVLGYYQRTTSPIYGVIFEISLQFTHPQSRIILILNDTTNCLLTNSRVFGTPLPPMW
jgi:hypothetical protein